MVKILMISGPALGHVARLSLIATALLSREEVSVDFVVPSFCQHMKIPTDLGCTIHPIHIADDDRKFPALPYAEAIERLLRRLKPDLIVQDCSPMRWLPAVRFPDCPRIIVTNAFLTAHADLETYQKTEFITRQRFLQDVRQKKALPQLRSSYDLYEGTKVLLSDPPPLTELFGKWPKNAKNCGPLCLEDKTPLPVTLSDKSRIALFSMGSTGGLEAFSDIAQKFKMSNDFDATVYVGSKAAEAEQSGFFDFCFDWLPLSSALEQARVCVTHGGTGSTYLALSKGVPVLMSPTHANHGLLADCLVRLGVGDYLGDGQVMEKIAQMHLKLSQNVDKFDHNTAPQRHADAIFDVLKC